MPPAIRTLPSGRRVALCPERGARVGAAAFSEPATEAVDVETVGELVLNARVAMAKPMTIETTRNSRSGSCGSSSKIRRPRTTLVSKMTHWNAALLYAPTSSFFSLGSYSTMYPATALAATVNGDAKYICPGPLRPGKFRFCALITT